MVAEVTLPPSVTEAAFLSATAHIAKVLYRKLGTTIGTAEDFAQQVVVWSLEALPAYQEGRPLEGYLLSNARNRALNYYRDHVSRRDAPCRSCHEGVPCTDGAYCRPYAQWLERNKAKANLARPGGIEVVMGLTKPSRVEPDAIGRELAELIDAQLPIEFRQWYLQMLAGVPVALDRKRRVREAVADILGLADLARDETTPTEEVY